MAGVAQVGDGLDACGSSPLYLSDEDLIESLDAVMVAASRLAALQCGFDRACSAGTAVRTGAVAAAGKVRCQRYGR